MLIKVYNNYQDYLEKRHIHQKHIINKGMFADDEDTMTNVYKL
jgi:hypothetical protein